MTAATGDRSLQEEVADGGNVNDIMLMLMECTQENVPIDENQTASLRCSWLTQKTDDALLVLCPTSTESFIEQLLLHPVLYP